MLSLSFVRPQEAVCIFLVCEYVVLSILFRRLTIVSWNKLTPSLSMVMNILETLVV